MPEAHYHGVSLAKALDAEIERLQRCRGWIRRVDQDLLRAGKKCFPTEIEFARWLSTPLATLKGRAPIEIMHARDGQSLVHGMLAVMGNEQPPRKRRLLAWKRLPLLPAFRELMRKPNAGSLQEALDGVRER